MAHWLRQRAPILRYLYIAYSGFNTIQRDLVIKLKPFRVKYELLLWNFNETSSSLDRF